MPCSTKGKQMGFDLRMLPFDYDQGSFGFSYAILSLERRRELWGPIGEIENQYGVDVPEHFSSYGEHGYGRTTTTPYGNKLKCVPVEKLVPLSTHEAVTDNLTNLAIWAYLSHLPNGTKVALYWH